MFKHQLHSMLVDRHYDAKFDLLNFIGKSCEMLCEEIIEWCLEQCLDVTEVQVDEDGENGARVLYEPEQPKAECSKALNDEDEDAWVAPKPPLAIFVVGWTGAGKSTAAQKLSDLMGTESYEVSEMIRRHLRVRAAKVGHKQPKERDITIQEKNKRREKIAKSVDAADVAAMISKKIDEHQELYGDIPPIFVGLRQYAAFEILARHTRERFKVVVVSHTPVELRADRLGMTVEEYIQGPNVLDLELGLARLVDEADIQL